VNAERIDADTIAGLLRRSVGEDRVWPDDFGPSTRLDGDLLLEDADMAAFGEELRQRYGDRVDLIGFVADLDIDRIIALSVAGVADYVAECCISSDGRAGCA
jgi:acyl carrier protein